MIELNDMTISDRDLIATVHNRFGNRTISRFDYTNDEIGRRIARADSGEAFSTSMMLNMHGFSARALVEGKLVLVERETDRPK